MTKSRYNTDNGGQSPHAKRRHFWVTLTVALMAVAALVLAAPGCGRSRQEPDKKEEGKGAKDLPKLAKSVVKAADANRDGSSSADSSEAAGRRAGEGRMIRKPLQERVRDSAAGQQKAAAADEGGRREKRNKGARGPAEAAPAVATLPEAAGLAAPAAPGPEKGGSPEVKRYDFASLEGIAIKDWFFPSKDYLLTPKGVCFAPKEQSGPVAVLSGAAAEAAQVNSVKVQVAALRNDAAVPIQRVRFFWARPGDVQAAGGKWPFGPDRNVVLQRGGENSDSWVGSVSGHANWNGAIERLFVEVSLPDDQWANRDQLRLVLSSVELLGK